MTTTIEIANLLARIEPEGSFATRRTMPAEDLHLKVEGSGPLSFPITPKVARSLCTVARPAPYGRGTKTLVDPRVRDTWSVPKSRIQIDAARWDRALRPQLDQIACDLGLPIGARLSAELHDLLVYEPGQFFATHQDSEKADGMVGTLVVNLPSTYSGGEMIVRHGRASKTLGGRSSSQLELIAFYADCRHEIRPLTRGYRVALVYNLILEGPKKRPAPSDVVVETLARAIDAHFATSRPPSWSKGETPPPPGRLVCLLEHEYSPIGLSWSRLKHPDAARVAALLAVADLLDCEAALALADLA